MPATPACAGPVRRLDPAVTTPLAASRPAARRQPVFAQFPVAVISRSRGEAHAHIAKAPRKEGPIECVTEYLISRIGRHLPLSVAEGPLARLRTGGAKFDDVRFLSRQFLDRAAGEQLVHGFLELVETVSTPVPASVETQRDEQAQHPRRTRPQRFGESPSDPLVQIETVRHD